MEIEKRCVWCGRTFIAHTVTTKYCSHSCNGAHYKQKKREEKLRKVTEQESKYTISSMESVKEKQFFSPSEVSVLLGVSRATIYRYMCNGTIRALQLKRTTIIRKNDLDKLFDNAPEYRKRNYGIKEENSYYTLQEIIEKFNISKKAVWRRCDKYDIPKIYKGRRTYFNKASIDAKFGELIEEFNRDNYYSIKEIMEKFEMTQKAVLSFVFRHKIPRIKRLRDVFYSKVHVDCIRRESDDLDPEFYTYDEVAEKFKLSKDQISYYIRNYNIKTEKRGRYTMISRIGFDQTVEERMKGLILKEHDSKKEKNKSSKIKEPIKTPDGYYSAAEIAENQKMNIKHVWNMMREYNIPKISLKHYNFYEKTAVDELFIKNAEFAHITEWLTSEEVEKAYNMTPAGRRSFAYRHDIPSKLVFGITYYSKVHIEDAKNLKFKGREKYYSVEEAIKKYNLTKEMLFYYAYSRKVPRHREGKFVFFLAEEIDRIMTKAKDEIGI